MTSWQWLFERGFPKAFLPSLILLGLCPWAKSLHGHSSCLITSPHSDRCCFLCFRLLWFFSSRRNLFTCTANSTWYFSFPLSGDRSGTPRWKDCLGLAPQAWAWGTSVPTPWICALRGAESRVTKESLGSVMLITDLHSLGASQITFLINTKNM